MCGSLNVPLHCLSLGLEGKSTFSSPVTTAEFSKCAVILSAALSQHHLLAVGAQYATGDQWRNNSRKNEEMELKQQQHPVVDVTGDGGKIQCCKEQYCIGACNVMSINQGKLEVVKQEMVRVNIDILGISELRWTGMGEFNSNDHYIYAVGRNPLEEME